MIKLLINKKLIKYLPLSIILSIIFSFLFDIKFLFSISLVLAIMSIVIYSQKLYDNFSIVFFMFTFMFFVMGSELPSIIFNINIVRDASEDANIHYYNSIFISLLGLILGYQIKKLDKKSKFDITKLKKNSFTISTQIISKKIFYISFFFYVLPVLERIYFVREFSYYESYVSYQTAIPYAITFIGNICPIAFSLYLATFPEKKDCKWPLILYTLYSCLYLLTGKRYLMVSSVLFIVTYLIIRNKTDMGKGVVWITRKTILVLLMSMPVCGVLLAAYSTLRTGVDLDSNVTFKSLLIVLFANVADTDKVIKYGYMLRDIIPENHIYCIGNMIDYFQFSNLSKIFFGNEVLVSQTAEYALQGNNFSYMLSYLYYPSKFLSGHGLGSCYIAELYQDFGYMGIFLGNLVVGIMLRNIFIINNTSIWRNCLVIYTYRLLLLTPRNSFDVIFREIFAISFLISIFFIYILVQNYNKKLKLLCQEKIQNE